MLANLLKRGGLLLGVGLVSMSMAQELDRLRDRDVGGEVTGEPLQSRTEARNQLLDMSVEGMAADQLTESVRARLQECQAEVEAYVLRKREQAQDGTATSQELREQLRAQLREAREQYVEDASQLRERIRDRVAALKEQLRSHGEFLDEAKMQARERVSEDLEGARERLREGMD